MRSSLLKFLKQATALLLVYALPVATCPAGAAATSIPQEQAAPESVKVPNEQLDSLVAPIALYPDPLLAQVLVASTYPLEVIQLQQFLDKNKGLKDKALTDAVMKQDWDPAIQSLAALPDVVKILSENIKWTTDLGNAFLAQQNDVMNAVQRMREKAKDKGQLKTTQQQKVETKIIENKEVIIIEQSSPDVVYVPSYDPVVVYGAPPYPYYPMTYPPGYAVAGMALSFGVGMMVGAAWGGGWCCNSSWGGNNNININNNNNFVNNSNRQNMSGNRQNVGSGNRGQGGNSQWKHNPQHRGGAPYGDRKTASQFGGSARGDSMSNRQASARQQQGRMQQSGMRDSGRGAGPSTMDRGGRGGTSGMDRGGSGFGGDRAGSRDVSRGSGGGAFGGASSGMSGRGAGASQSRGSSSMGSRGGSSGFSGGGGRSGGGGGRSGGGRRR